MAPDVPPDAPFAPVVATEVLSGDHATDHLVHVEAYPIPSAAPPAPARARVRAPPRARARRRRRARRRAARDRVRRRVPAPAVGGRRRGGRSPAQALRYYGAALGALNVCLGLERDAQAELVRLKIAEFTRARERAPRCRGGARGARGRRARGRRARARRGRRARAARGSDRRGARAPPDDAAARARAPRARSRSTRRASTRPRATSTSPRPRPRRAPRARAGGRAPRRGGRARVAAARPRRGDRRAPAARRRRARALAAAAAARRRARARRRGRRRARRRGAAAAGDLSAAEKEVLRRSSFIDGRLYPPWLDGDEARETFAYPAGRPFEDPDGVLALAPAQRAHFARWARPSELYAAGAAARAPARACSATRAPTRAASCRSS